MARPITHGAAKRVRKNMDMDAEKLEKARQVLGARTETETVDLALDYVVSHGEVFSALDRLADAGGLSDAYGESSAARPAVVAERSRGR